LFRYSESVTDSIANFPRRFGRTFHAYKDGSYVFPNDSYECERMELQGLVMTELLGGKWFLAPISQEGPPQRMLDIGTGTGIWALEMGDRFPEAKVIGIDLSPIQPTAVPSNVHFYVQDASQSWDFHELFDFVFSRASLGCYADYKNEIIQQAFDNLHPGGWLECQEFDCQFYCDDDTLKPDSPLHEWARQMNAAAESIQRPLTMSGKVKQWYDEVGFVDVREKVFKVPMNGWAKDPRYKALGKLWETNFLGGLSGFTLSLFTQVLGMTREEVEVQLVNVRKETANPYVHSYMKIHVIYGRKPFPHEMVQ
ncbi:S-adenosyl-L-methionine-dependent methyltransferase, partial [Plectosphaerella cucumerina]